MLASRQCERSGVIITESHRVQVAGGHIHVRATGDGPLVILLHGWTLDGRVWQPQTQISGFRLVMPDRRGFGQSSAPPCLTAERDDIMRLAEHFGAAHFALIGLSQGAAVALDAACHYPSAVKALALIGAPLHHLVSEPEGAAEIDRSEMARLVCAGRLGEMLQLWSRHPLTQVAPDARKLMHDILADYDGRDQLVDQAPLTFTAQDISSLKIPLLAMAGAQDSDWRIRVAHYIGENVFRGKTEIVEAAGHIANVDAAQIVNRLLQDFLNIYFLKEL